MPIERLAAYIKSLEEHAADVPHTDPPDFTDTRLLNIGNRQTSLPRNILAQFGIGSPSVDGRGITRYSRGFIQSDVQSLQSAVQIGPGSFAQTPESTAYGSYSTALDRGGVAIGLYARSTLPDAIAIGEQSDVRGAYSIALGTRCIVTSPYAVTVGIQSQNSGSGYGIGIGYQAIVSSIYGIAIGASSQALSTANARACIAIGYLSVAAGDLSLAIGYSSSARGATSIAIGYSASVPATITDGIAIGDLALAGFNNSIAIGSGASTTAVNQMVIGASANPMDIIVFAATTNGSSWTFKDTNNVISNAITIAHRITVGTTPTAGLGVAVRYQLDNSNNILKTAITEAAVWTTAGAGAESADLVFSNSNAGTVVEAARIVSGGNVQAVGNLVLKANGVQLGAITHINTATRTWTMPDATGNITYETAVLTNNNFLLGGGGALVKDSTFSVVPIANGGTAGTTAATARANLVAAQAGGVGIHTITLAKITPGGANGSISWNADGAVTAFVDPT